MLDLSNMKIIVISLEGYDDRKKSISMQLDSLGLKYEFFNAINPKKNIEFQKNYNSNLAKSIYKRDLTLGELGCSLSHKFIYKKLSNDNCDYYLILEDDAIISKDIVVLLNNLSRIDEKWDVILLGYSKVSPLYYKKLNKFHPTGSYIFKFKDYSIGRVYKNSTCGTVAYLITKNGANNFLKESDKYVFNLADDWLFFEKKLSLKIFHCRPFLVFEDYLTFDSSIEKDRSEISKKSLNVFFKNQLMYLRGYFRFLFIYLFK